MEFGTSNRYCKLQRSRERRNSFEWLSALERAENSVSLASSLRWDSSGPGQAVN